MMWEVGIDKKRGFSLLEIMVALLLVGIFTAIAIPTFRSIHSNEFKSTSNRLVGLIRDTYSRASLSGKTCRIVFDLSGRTYWVEESSGSVKLQSESQEKEARENQEPKKIMKDSDFKAVEDALGKKQKLPADVYFKSIWIDHFEKRITEGQVALYFFPDGYTEEAQIILTDTPEAKRIYNLVIEPLTGTVVIEDRELPFEE